MSSSQQTFPSDSLVDHWFHRYEDYICLFSELQVHRKRIFHLFSVAYSDFLLQNKINSK